jgi:hypothetical protein
MDDLIKRLMLRAIDHRQLGLADAFAQTIVLEIDRLSSRPGCGSLRRLLRACHD